jgi:hypothetical protein
VVQLLVWLPVALMGFMAAWGAGSNGKPVGVIVGVPLILLAFLAVLSNCSARVRLVNGLLSSGSILGRRSVKVDAITGVSRVELTPQMRGVYGVIPRFWRVRWRFLEPRTSLGPSGVWLSSRAFGERSIERLLSTMKLEPDIETEHRTVRWF